MNICYEIPSRLRHQSFYEQLKTKVETNYADKHFEVSQHLIVPKKSGRCMFVQRGTNIVECTINIDM